MVYQYLNQLCIHYQTSLDMSPVLKVACVATLIYVHHGNRCLRTAPNPLGTRTEEVRY